MKINVAFIKSNRLLMESAVRSRIAIDYEIITEGAAAQVPMCGFQGMLVAHRTFITTEIVENGTGASSGCAYPDQSVEIPIYEVVMMRSGGRPSGTALVYTGAKLKINLSDDALGDVIAWYANLLHGRAKSPMYDSLHVVNKDSEVAKVVSIAGIIDGYEQIPYTAVIEQ